MIKMFLNIMKLENDSIRILVPELQFNLVILIPFFSDFFVLN